MWLVEKWKGKEEEKKEKLKKEEEKNGVGW